MSKKKKISYPLIIIIIIIILILALFLRLEFPNSTTICLNKAIDRFVIGSVYCDNKCPSMDGYGCRACYESVIDTLIDDKWECRY